MCLFIVPLNGYSLSSLSLSLSLSLAARQLMPSDRSLMEYVLSHNCIVESNDCQKCTTRFNLPVTLLVTCSPFVSVHCVSVSLKNVNINSRLSSSGLLTFSLPPSSLFLHFILFLNCTLLCYYCVSVCVSSCLNLLSHKVHSYLDTN